MTHSLYRSFLPYLAMACSLSGCVGDVPSDLESSSTGITAFEGEQDEGSDGDDVPEEFLPSAQILFPNSHTSVGGVPEFRPPEAVSVVVNAVPNFDRPTPVANLHVWLEALDSRGLTAWTREIADGAKLTVSTTLRDLAPGNYYVWGSSTDIEGVEGFSGFLFRIRPLKQGPGKAPLTKLKYEYTDRTFTAIRFRVTTSDPDHIDDPNDPDDSGIAKVEFFRDGEAKGQGVMRPPAAPNPTQFEFIGDQVVPASPFVAQVRVTDTDGNQTVERRFFDL